MCPSPCSRVSDQVKECVMLAIFLDLTINPGYALLTKTLSEPAALWSLHRYTHSKKYLISGSDNGIVRVQEAPVPGQLQMAEKSKYWEAGLHDSFYGVVGGATLSFDDHYLCFEGWQFFCPYY
jgi:hypothetical protein